MQEIGDIDELPDDSEVALCHKPPKGMVPAAAKPAAASRVEGDAGQKGEASGCADAAAEAAKGSAAPASPMLSPIERVRKAYSARQQQHHGRGRQHVQPMAIVAAESKRLSDHLDSLQGRDDPEYAQIREQKEQLPAHSMRTSIVETIASNQVVVISGSTGCGKTTQVPQFVLESAIRSGCGAACTILCTQPRRISAVGVADRVAAERGEKCGETVGYQIRLESKSGPRTRLKFMTTGILLRRTERL